MTYNEDNEQELSLSHPGKNWAVASLVLGGISLANITILYITPDLWALLLGPFFLFAGGITGCVGAAKSSKASELGRAMGFAQIGIVLAILSLVLYILWFSYISTACQQYPMGCA